MKPQISIIIPGIRVANWEKLYDSIVNSTSTSFEIIFVGPYALPNSLQNKKNIKYVKDFGSPVRCSNIGLLLCEGDLLTYQADDGKYLPHMLDKAIQVYKEMSVDVLMLKYMEGTWTYQPTSYWQLCKAYPPVSTVHDDWWIFNMVLTKTDYFKHLGGWDSQFETQAFSHADMAVRAQKSGCVVGVFDEPIVHNEHGHDDHKPIEDAHNQHDDPLYRSIHDTPNNRVCIDINNWMKAPSAWERRFGVTN